MNLRPRKRTLLLGGLALVAALAIGCRQVGVGDLHVANDQSGIGQDNTVLRAYESDPGEPWPPVDSVNLWVKGDDFGHPPAFGMDGYLYLVRTSLACPMSEGAPEAFALADVTIVGIVTVRDGGVDQFLTMADSPAARSPRWALIEVPEFPGTGGAHLVHRCGTVTWVP